jgi:hypothetical protein
VELGVTPAAHTACSPPCSTVAMPFVPWRHHSNPDSSPVISWRPKFSTSNTRVGRSTPDEYTHVAILLRYNVFCHYKCI